MECSLNNIIKKKNYENNNNSAENLLFNRMLCHQQNRYDSITDMVTKHM